MANYAEIMNIMAEAVEKASYVVRSDFLNNQESGVVKFSDKEAKLCLDFVTETDKKSEDIIKSYLAEKCSDIEFVGEESGGDLSKEKFFLVDPLDGTSNFLALKSYFAICAAYVENGEVKAAVIADPFNNRIVKAAYGLGAYYVSGKSENKIKARDYSANNMKEMQLECEIPIRKFDDMVSVKGYGKIKPLEFISPLTPYLSGFRKSGSTALDILNLCLGQKSVIISSNLAPHDIAAGVLIAEESGLAITDFKGNKARFDSDAVLVAHAEIHKKALELLSVEL